MRATPAGRAANAMSNESPETKKKRKPRWLRILIGLVVFLAVLVAVVQYALGPIVKTTAEGLSSEAYGMDQIQQFIANHHMTVEWNAATCQNYAEVHEDDASYQIWVEDAESIEKKLEVMQSHKIAGVAEWCLGMESSDVWDVISEYMEK